MTILAFYLLAYQDAPDDWLVGVIPLDEHLDECGPLRELRKVNPTHEAVREYADRFKIKWQERVDVETP